ncbi:TPA: fimbrial biogenesis outer membrane usher protein [Burkholderia cenocepacia]|uniref:fimbria/pilus outer membrane usher protein n=1 Tax=unclassified Burkholderia TaxID=2613784 RepID=UPI00158CD095|nr:MULTISPECIES: fimbria/pilus outer membrane usher protein [unclassified Burkholderia]HEF5874733.1 fimbrial biogenesis outer membrane usher protein [Burkholderia cenocepacia]
MEHAHRAAKPCASPPAPVLRRSCAMVLLACSAMPLGAAANTLAPVDDRQPRLGERTTRQDTPPTGVQFNPDFVLSEPGSELDLSRYEQGNPVWPGQYRADVYLNGTLLGRDDVTVREVSSGVTKVCASRRLLDKFNLDLGRIPAEQLATLDEAGTCVSLEELVPGTSLSLDASAARVDVQIPQALLRRTARGYVDPSMWDHGVTAGILGYNANVYRNVSHGAGSNSAYIGVNAGLNVGGWYFRHDGALNWQQREGQHYGAINTYLQRDLTAINARVRVGDANTSGEVFDTFAFRGVQIATDDRMWPDSQRGYAPVVRGIANSNARVTVRQNSAIIYDTTVPPGSFVIDDLYPTGYGGDLDVTVTEADGSEHRFKVPYAAVPQSLRPGRSRFSFVAGTVRDQSLSHTPRIVQATYTRGINNLLTLYGGVLANENYQNVLLGGAFNLPIGALAIDMSGAFTSKFGQKMNGTSVRVTYSKTIEATNSNLSVAAYRFSSSGYLDLNNAMAFVDNTQRNLTGAAAVPASRARNRVSVTASQRFGERGGQLYVSGYTQNYWSRSGTDTQFQVGYSNRYRMFDYSVSANRSRTLSGDADTQYMLTVSMPLGPKERAPRMSVNLARDNTSGFTSMATATGLIGAGSEGSYSVSAARNAGPTYAGNVAAQYRTPYTAVQGAFGKGSGYGSASFGMSGAIVAHPGGVTATPYASDTMAIVAAPRAHGATVTGYGGVRLDPRGYAVVPYLSPYRLNQIEIDPRGLPADVELQSTSQQVAPRHGAVVMLRYPTVTGRAVLIQTQASDGTELPLGAPVFDGNGNNVGMVSQGGQIYARLSVPRDRLTVKWGHADAWQCSIKVALPSLDERSAPTNIERVDSPCEIEAKPAGVAGKRTKQQPSA